MKQYLANIGLVTKISLLFGGLTLILSVFLGGVFLYEQKRLIDKHITTRRLSLDEEVEYRRKHRFDFLAKESDFYAETIARSLTLSLYCIENKSSEPILKAFMRMSWVKGIVVLNDNEEIFAAIWRDNENMTIFSMKGVPKYLTHECKLKTKEIIHNSQRLGTVKMYYSEQMVINEINEIRQDSIQHVIKNEDSAYKELSDAAFYQAILGFFAILIVMAVTAIIGKSIVRPALHVATCIQELGKRNLSMFVPENDLQRGDELGLIAQGYERTRSYLITTISYLNKNASALSEASDELSELSTTIYTKAENMNNQSHILFEYADQTGQQIKHISQKTNEASSNINSINDNMGMLNENIHAMATSSSQASLSMSEISNHIYEIYGDIKKVNTSVETMTADLTSVSRHSSEAVTITKNANSQLNNSLEMLTKLQDASQTIYDAVNLISTISTQTNLLALNATIEAVSAGDAGRGFAVVAEEVKNLAGKAREANDEIGKILEEIREYINTTVESIHSTSEVLKQLLDNNIVIGESISRQREVSNEIMVFVDSISHSSGDSVRMIKQADEGLKQITTSATDVALIAKESSVNTSEVATSIFQIAKSCQAVLASTNEVIQNIKTIQESTKNVTNVASGNKQSSLALSKMAEELNDAVESFNI